MERAPRPPPELAASPDASRIGRSRWMTSSCMRPKPQAFKRSELQAAFAGCVCERLDATVVTVAGAVECNFLVAGSQCLLGDRAAHLGGSVGVLAILQAFAHLGLGGAGRGQDLRAIRAEELRVQVLAGA